MRQGHADPGARRRQRQRLPLQALPHTPSSHRRHHLQGPSSCRLVGPDFQGSLADDLRFVFVFRFLPGFLLQEREGLPLR